MIFTLVPHIFRGSCINAAINTQLRVYTCINAATAHMRACNMRSAAPLSRGVEVVAVVVCCFISCGDFVKRPCAWESEAVW